MCKASDLNIIYYTVNFRDPHVYQRYTQSISAYVASIWVTMLFQYNTVCQCKLVNTRRKLCPNLLPKCALKTC